LHRKQNQQGRKTREAKKCASNGAPQLSYIDAVVVSHEFTDRMALRFLKSGIRRDLIQENETRVPV
jgi:hypothetical protein